MSAAHQSGRSAALAVMGPPNVTHASTASQQHKVNCHLRDLLDGVIGAFVERTNANVQVLGGHTLNKHNKATTETIDFATTVKRTKYLLQGETANKSTKPKAKAKSNAGKSTKSTKSKATGTATVRKLTSEWGPSSSAVFAPIHPQEYARFSSVSPEPADQPTTKQVDTAGQPASSVAKLYQSSTESDVANWLSATGFSPMVVDAFNGCDGDDLRKLNYIEILEKLSPILESKTASDTARKIREKLSG